VAGSALACAIWFNKGCLSQIARAMRKAFRTMDKFFIEEGNKARCLKFRFFSHESIKKSALVMPTAWFESKVAEVWRGILSWAFG
jgi:hypothetical protein